MDAGTRLPVAYLAALVIFYLVSVRAAQEADRYNFSPLYAFFRNGQLPAMPQKRALLLAKAQHFVFKRRTRVDRNLPIGLNDVHAWIVICQLASTTYTRGS